MSYLPKDATLAIALLGKPKSESSFDVLRLLQQYGHEIDFAIDGNSRFKLKDAASYYLKNNNAPDWRVVDLIWSHRDRQSIEQDLFVAALATVINKE